MTQPRDNRLQRDLRTLDVPDYPDGRFFEHLADRLAEEDARQAAALAPTPRRRARRWHGWRTLVPVGALACAVLVAGAILPQDDDGGSPLAPDVASAAQVIRTVQRTFARANSVRGTYQWTFRESPGSRPSVAEPVRFVTTADGSHRSDSGNGASEVATQAFDASALTETSHFRSREEGGFEYVTVRTGLPLAPPDLHPSSSMLNRDLRDVVRAMSTGEPGSVREGEVDGRAAWTVTVAVDELPGYSPLRIDELVVSVDRKAGLPVRVEERSDGRTLATLRITDLQIDEAVGQSLFRPSLPGVRRETGMGPQDWGFRRTTVADIRRELGYEVVRAGWLPGGFDDPDVIAARSPEPRYEATKRSRDVVQLVYRRGLDEVVVTTRRAESGSPDAATRDPFRLDGAPQALRPPRETTLQNGALAGALVRTQTADPRTGVHAWAVQDGLLVTVAGSLEPDELRRVLRELERGPAPDRRQ